MAMSRRTWKNLVAGIGFLSPNILGFLAFTVIPLVLSLILAFTNWDLTRHNIFKNEPLEFTGLAHFIYMFGHPRFWQSFWNTLFFMMGIPFGIAGSLGLAMLLSRDLRGGSRNNGFIIFYTSVLITMGMVICLVIFYMVGVPVASMVIMFAAVACAVMILGTAAGTTLYRTLFYLPAFTSGVAIFLLWAKMYTRTGPMSAALRPPLRGMSEAIDTAPHPALQFIVWLAIGGFLFALIYGIRNRGDGPGRMMLTLAALVGIGWAVLSLFSFATGAVGIMTPVVATNELLVATIVRGGYWFFMVLGLLVLHWGLGRIAWLKREGDIGAAGVGVAGFLAFLPWLVAVIAGWIPSFDHGGVGEILTWLPMIPAALILLCHLPGMVQPSAFPCAPSEGTGTGIMFGSVVLIFQFTLIGLAIACFNWWDEAVTVAAAAAAHTGDGDVPRFMVTPPDWLDQAAWAKPSLMIMGLWAGIGSNNMLLYLAGLSNVPQDLYEAADIDGASKGQRFWHVTWPQLAPTTFFIVVMSVIGGLQGGFEMARTMTGGGPDGATTTLAYYIYTQGFEMGRLGYASAVAWTLFAFVFTVTMFNWKFGNKYVNE
ncbi:MAG: sugar ABC transporter permease [Phycisphaeraceae bacterium]|nr:sugar ABC transporter permease [Phycisphaeraceae bacterium]